MKIKTILLLILVVACSVNHYFSGNFEYDVLSETYPEELLDSYKAIYTKRAEPIFDLADKITGVKVKAYTVCQYIFFREPPDFEDCITLALLGHELSHVEDSRSILECPVTGLVYILEYGKELLQNGKGAYHKHPAEKKAEEKEEEVYDNCLNKKYEVRE